MFRQLFDPTSSTYSYLVADGGEALLIDSVFEQASRDAALVEELGLRLLATLETHVHADHVTGAWLHKRRFQSRILVAGTAGVEGADRLLAHGDRVAYGARQLEVRATPGHTAGCLTFVSDDQAFAFTGDCVLVRACGRTDFQGGDAATLYRSVHGQIFTLPPECLLYPAHDYRGLTVTSVGEERRFNPRLGGNILEADFVGYQEHLGLPHPKQMAVAVPANLRCGRPEVEPPPDPAWAPLTFRFAGHWEIEPQALSEISAQIIDVREPDEFDGALGHIAGARLIPLGELAARLDEIDRARPVVTVCRSGARSARASQLLAKAGFTQVANLAGGMLRWLGDTHRV
jgi:glyoxylase-like metal-dependent hydrolase (beta-lactamase superfamily II)/rhodanese-related sulfurtransferase